MTFSDAGFLGILRVKGEVRKQEKKKVLLIERKKAKKKKHHVSAMINKYRLVNYTSELFPCAVRYSIVLFAIDSIERNCWFSPYS